MASISHYAVLDISPDAAPEDVKRAYRSMAGKTHPDRGGMTHMFRMVQEAYETLSDPDLRAAYDREMGFAPVPDAPAARYDEGGYEDAGHDEQDDAPAYEDEAPVPQRKRLRPAMIVWAAVVAAVGAYFVFQCVGLLALTQPKTPYRLYTANGTPAVVYFVLWAVGALAAVFADTWFRTVRAPLACAVLAGAFALVTATGTFPVWTLALGTGLALTLVIALPLQILRADNYRK
ncbi:J domain-containing protein [Pseudarthrobacter sp. BIM B-2242]|uniref:J domain-containing protein n=1 Tax=Pseudarthrobacter sp. BIM B-2242 TaxID=2772401 RepID=UPI00168B1479|nr:J domain-containing protein [Pseudarthrobacter sp. BIM B-2242]QOD05856.1 J domain-containing protein [Pseudarthrobacter sp. BIM B-2242]